MSARGPNGFASPARMKKPDARQSRRATKDGDLEGGVFGSQLAML
jgi:hypothetical protein